MTVQINFDVPEFLLIFVIRKRKFILSVMSYRNSGVAVRLDPKDWNREFGVAGGGTVFTGISGEDTEEDKSVYLCVRMKDTADDTEEWLRKAFLYREYDYAAAYVLEGSRVSVSESDFSAGNTVIEPEVFIVSDPSEIIRETTGMYNPQVLFTIDHIDGEVTGIGVYGTDCDGSGKDLKTEHSGWKRVRTLTDIQQITDNTVSSG